MLINVNTSRKRRAQKLNIFQHYVKLRLRNRARFASSVSRGFVHRSLLVRIARAGSAAWRSLESGGSIVTRRGVAGARERGGVCLARGRWAPRGMAATTG